MKYEKRERNLQRREAREHLGLSTADDPPQHYSTLLTTPPLSGSPFSFVFLSFFPGVPGGRGFWVGSLGIWSVFAPPLGNHGEGCFDAWGTAGGLCVLGAGFLCFPVFFSSFHTHPLAPFPLLGHVSLHGYLVVSFCLIFCLFLVLFLVIVLTVVVYSVRSVTHFKCRRHYLITQFCVGFLLFFWLSFVTSFFFCFFTPTLCCSQPPPPPYRDGDWGYFGPQAQKKISRGEIWAFQVDKIKIKNTLALREMTAGFQKK